MLSDLTWSQYLASAAFLVLVYYIGVITWYYRQEARALLRKLSRQQPVYPEEEEEAQEHDFLSYDALKEVASQLRQGILEEAGTPASKQQLLLRLKAILAHCGGLRQPASRGALNHYIIQQAAALRGIVLTEEELEKEWETLEGP